MLIEDNEIPGSRRIGKMSVTFGLHARQLAKSITLQVMTDIKTLIFCDLMIELLNSGYLAWDETMYVVSAPRACRRLQNEFA